MTAREQYHLADRWARNYAPQLAYVGTAGTARTVTAQNMGHYIARTMRERGYVLVTRKGQRLFDAIFNPAIGCESR